MPIHNIARYIKEWALMIALVVGISLHHFLEWIVGCCPWLIPLLIFTMLTLSFSRLEKPDKHSKWRCLLLLLVQFGGGMVLYYLLLPINKNLADGLMVTVMVSPATAGPVITNLLHGKLGFITLYLLICSIVSAFWFPLWFSWIGVNNVDFWISALQIALRTLPLLLLPLLIVYTLRRRLPRGYQMLRKYTGSTIYLWSLSLMLLIGHATDNFLRQPDHPFAAIALVCAFICCLFLIGLGKYIGHFHNDSVGTGQALGQKNTVIAVWLTEIYFTPLAMVVPTMYIIAQNVINFLQVRYVQATTKEQEEPPTRTNRGR